MSPPLRHILPTYTHDYEGIFFSVPRSSFSPTTATVFLTDPSASNTERNGLLLTHSISTQKMAGPSMTVRVTRSRNEDSFSVAFRPFPLFMFFCSGVPLLQGCSVPKTCPPLGAMRTSPLHPPEQRKSKWICPFSKSRRSRLLALAVPPLHRVDLSRSSEWQDI